MAREKTGEQVINGVLFEEFNFPEEGEEMTKQEQKAAMKAARASFKSK